MNLDQSLARTLSFSIKSVMYLSLSHSAMSSWSILSSQIFIYHECFIEVYIQIFTSYISFQEQNASFSLVSVINFKVTRVLSWLLLSFSKQKMSQKHPTNSETEGASEKDSFALERGPWETLKTHGKQIFLFILLVFRNGLLKNSWSLRW